MVISLQEDILEKIAFETAQQELYVRLMQTYENLYEDFARLLKEYGITQAQYNVLRILREVNPRGLRTLDILKCLVNRVPDITRLVDRMENSGLVRRRHFPDDRRVVLVQITQKGLRLFNSLSIPVDNHHREQFGHLTELEQTELNRLLAKAGHQEG